MPSFELSQALVYSLDDIEGEQRSRMAAFLYPTEIWSSLTGAMSRSRDCAQLRLDLMSMSCGIRHFLHLSSGIKVRQLSHLPSQLTALQRLNFRPPKAYTTVENYTLVAVSFSARQTG